MIAVDTSSLIAFFGGESGADVEAVGDAFRSGTAMLPLVVLSEILSDPDFPQTLETHILGIPMLEITEGFWERMGRLRRAALKRGFRARLPDSLIAQTCIDHNVTLISRDKDFQGFRKVSAFKLM